MSLIDHVYKDSGLTQQFDDATDTIAAFALSGDSGDGVFYVGVPSASRKIQDETNPGVDQIICSLSDSGVGTGAEVADVQLALTQGGLAAATPGASLNLGATINGGSGNAVSVWYRWTNNAGNGTFTDLSLQLSSRVESDI